MTVAIGIAIENERRRNMTIMKMITKGAITDDRLPVARKTPVNERVTKLQNIGE